MSTLYRASGSRSSAACAFALAPHTATSQPTKPKSVPRLYPKPSAPRTTPNCCHSERNKQDVVSSAPVVEDELSCEITGRIDPYSYGMPIDMYFSRNG